MNCILPGDFWRLFENVFNLFGRRKSRVGLRDVVAGRQSRTVLLSQDVIGSVYKRGVLIYGGDWRIIWKDQFRVNNDWQLRLFFSKGRLGCCCQVFGIFLLVLLKEVRMAAYSTFMVLIFHLIKRLF